MVWIRLLGQYKKARGMAFAGLHQPLAESDSEEVTGSRPGATAISPRTTGPVTGAIMESRARKNAQLRRRVDHRWRYGAPHGEGEGKSNTARKENRNNGTRALFTRSYRLRLHGLQ